MDIRVANGYQGIGKPEPLKENLSGWWSVRIDEENRLVFKIVGETNQTIAILQCRGDY